MIDRVFQLLRIGLSYITAILNLQRTDVLLISFPRSGNTWIRFILANYISLKELSGRRINFHFLSSMIPSTSHTIFTKNWRYRSTPRIVKSHNRYSPLLFRNQRKIIHVIRDPRDVMVSYYHYMSGHRIFKQSIDFRSFIRHSKYGLRACIRHYDSWKDRSTLLIRYEDLLEDPFDATRLIFADVSCECDEDVLRQAIVRSSFENIRQIQEKDGYPSPRRFNPHFRFVRSGQIGQWRNVFQDADLAYYQELCDEFGFGLYPNAKSNVDQNFLESHAFQTRENKRDQPNP